LACAGPAQVDKATDKDSVTAEQCIDNKTPGSVEPFEDALVQEGVVNADLDKIRITHGMCDEIIKRTPSGSPISRAAAVGNLTQELQIIKKSMEDAPDKDVNGDGTVNAEDERIANAASLAASRAAQQTVRRATEESSTDGGMIEELKAELAAYLAQERTTPSSGGQTTTTTGGQITTTTVEHHGEPKPTDNAFLSHTEGQWYFLHRIEKDIDENPKTWKPPDFTIVSLADGQVKHVRVRPNPPKASRVAPLLGVLGEEPLEKHPCKQGIT